MAFVSNGSLSANRPPNRASVTRMRRADRDTTLAALRDWSKQHGRFPSRRDWEVAAPGRPSTRTIDRRWGWQELVEDAGGPGADQLRRVNVQQRQQELLSALRAARHELGRWPTADEWERAKPTHAARRTYIRYFGSWGEACQLPNSFWPPRVSDRGLKCGALDASAYVGLRLLTLGNARERAQGNWSALA